MRSETADSGRQTAVRKEQSANNVGILFPRKPKQKDIRATLAELIYGLFQNTGGEAASCCRLLTAVCQLRSNAKIQ